MPHEGEALWGRETIEHDEESEADRVGEHGLLIRIGLANFFRQRLDDFCVQRFFAARGTRAKHVKADAGDHGGQPSAKVLDRVGVGAPEARCSLLCGELVWEGPTLGGRMEGMMDCGFCR